jgi:hypothetical protein
MFRAKRRFICLPVSGIYQFRFKRTYFDLEASLKMHVNSINSLRNASNLPSIANDGNIALGIGTGIYFRRILTRKQMLIIGPAYDILLYGEAGPKGRHLYQFSMKIGLAFK